MTLTGIALMRSVDSNVLIAGNIAYRQGATAGADWGVEAARAYVIAKAIANPNQLWNDDTAQAYYSTWQQALDLTGADPSKVTKFDWAANGKLVGTDAGGNEVRYVIHRICKLSGDPLAGGTDCVMTTQAGGAAANAGSTMGVVAYGTGVLQGQPTGYYRVTIRVLGPRNTRAFVQAVLR
jgi:hypothetical protein